MESDPIGLGIIGLDELSKDCGGPYMADGGSLSHFFQLLSLLPEDFCASTRFSETVNICLEQLLLHMGRQSTTQNEEIKNQYCEKHHKSGDGESPEPVESLSYTQPQTLVGDKKNLNINYETNNNYCISNNNSNITNTYQDESHIQQNEEIINSSNNNDNTALQSETNNILYRNNINNNNQHEYTYPTPTFKKKSPKHENSPTPSAFDPIDFSSPASTRSLLVAWVSDAGIPRPDSTQIPPVYKALSLLSKAGREMLATAIASCGWSFRLRLVRNASKALTAAMLPVFNALNIIRDEAAVLDPITTLDDYLILLHDQMRPWGGAAVIALQICYDANIILAKKASCMMPSRSTPMSAENEEGPDALLKRDAMREVRICNERVLAWDLFHLDCVNDALIIKFEFVSYALQSNTLQPSPLNFLENGMRGLINIEWKTNILKWESTLNHQHEGLVSQVLSLIYREQTYAYCFLKVRRSHLLEDSIDQLAKLPDVGRKLRVQFDEEPAIDQGGVSKEFFVLLVEEIKRADLGIFETVGVNSSQLIVRPGLLEAPVIMEIIGIICGLAVYNNQLVPLPLCSIMLKVLVGEEIGFSDLIKIYPENANSLLQLLEMESDALASLGLTFTANLDEWLGGGEVELVDGGSQIYVTVENVEYFVSLYCKWKLITCRGKELKMFKQGFARCFKGLSTTFKVEPSTLMGQLFRADEMSNVICGVDGGFYDASGVFLALSIVFVDGYSKGDFIANWMRQFCLEMSVEERNQFLTFVSGSDRLPVSTFSRETNRLISGIKTYKDVQNYIEFGGKIPVSSSFHITVCMNGNDDSRLPAAHTCFHQVMLPRYSSEQVLKEKLKIAIEHCHGFGLQ